MKTMRILFLIMVFCVAVVPGVLAVEQAGVNDESEISHAIGFAGGMTGGTGLSYKYMLDSKQMLQFTGGLMGNSNYSLNYNFGVEYQKVLFETSLTRLLLAPGFSWRQTIDLNKTDDVHKFDSIDKDGVIIGAEYYNNNEDAKSLFAGLTYGIEFKFDHVGIAFFTGYGVYVESQNSNSTYTTDAEATRGLMETNYGFNLTGDVALFYYF